MSEVSTVIRVMADKLAACMIATSYIHSSYIVELSIV